LRIAWIYLGREDYDAVRRALDELESPESQEALEVRARLALATGDTLAAREFARRLVASGLAASGSLLGAESWAAEGDPDLAIREYERAAAEFGGGVWSRASEVLRRYGYADRGERVLERWVETDPDNANAHFRLGAYLEREDRFGKAEPALREAIRLERDFAEALNHLGYSLAVRGKSLNEALEFVRRALALDPWNGAYLDSLGWVYYQMGRYREALEPLERAARELPRDATILEHLGDCYHSLGDPERALAVWNRALENEPQSVEKLRAKIALHGAPARGN